MTVSGVEPSVTSGLFPAGAGCAAAEERRANAANAASAQKRTADDLRCDIGMRPFTAEGRGSIAANGGRRWDIDMTKAIIDGKALGMGVHDHMNVGRDG